MKLFLETAFRWNTPCPLTDGAGRIRYTLVGDAFHLGTVSGSSRLSAAL